MILFLFLTQNIFAGPIDFSKFKPHSNNRHIYEAVVRELIKEFGVPVQTKTMSGLDSLYSIVQMPPGIPVATMAINGAKNAGLLAAKILGSYDTKLMKKVIAYMKDLEKMVVAKAEKLEKVGYQKYLKTSFK